MANPAKRKGDAFEREVVEALRAAGITAQRTRAGWADDQGDIETPELPIAWQCKNHKDVATALREGVDGAQEQATNAGKLFGVAVVKRRLQPASEAYVAMPLRVFVELLRDQIAK